MPEAADMPEADGDAGAARPLRGRLAGRPRFERRKKRTLPAARLSRTGRRHAGPRLTEMEILTALEKACLTATLAAVLFCGALSLNSIWDRAIFVEGLQEALTSNP